MRILINDVMMIILITIIYHYDHYYSFVEEKANILTFSGLHSWTSDIEWHPQDSNLLVSSNYDGCLAIYDIRSSYAIHSIPQVHEGKVLCCTWKNAGEILTGMDFMIRVGKWNC